MPRIIKYLQNLEKATEMQKGTVKNPERPPKCCAFWPLPGLRRSFRFCCTPLEIVQGFHRLFLPFFYVSSTPVVADSLPETHTKRYVFGTQRNIGKLTAMGDSGLPSGFVRQSSPASSNLRKVRL